jgi:predicted metal-dependent enzyme (double-stranded beta helix superfamily)
VHAEARVSFEVEAFVTACQHAATEVDPAGAVRDVVEAAIAEGPSIDAIFGTEVIGAFDTLFASPDLTVQRIGWPAGSRSSPHEHRMWAVVGVYAGTETNRLFERSRQGLIEQSVQHLEVGEVLVLGDDAIHAVANPLRGRTVGLHVYGGDIVGSARSAWSPDGKEVPFSEDATARLAMFRAVREIAAEHGRGLTHDDVYEAFAKLSSACAAAGQYVSSEDARSIVTDVWHLSDS